MSLDAHNDNANGRWAPLPSQAEMFRAYLNRALPVQYEAFRDYLVYRWSLDMKPLQPRWFANGDYRRDRPDHTNYSAADVDHWSPPPSVDSEYSAASPPSEYSSASTYSESASDDTENIILAHTWPLTRKSSHPGSEIASSNSVETEKTFRNAELICQLLLALSRDDVPSSTSAHLADILSVVGMSVLDLNDALDIFQLRHVPRSRLATVHNELVSSAKRQYETADSLLEAADKHYKAAAALDEFIQQE
ncbi:hypothetical protein CYLTODRAFT_413236 [Cylindrobasidium torrendii FP15055 ss-10]|uniref:Uncharacterized protein n=1 Tax=Cylindrobasidium torrendii FP15055 ss-10 TaxID=1314674 RepID=A0A0D7B4T7_9AGAR|nr:hypothetical protein CYLTODRAFT_413236 [Cylindrobasidium torrendii FP15055 ss-10]